MGEMYLKLYGPDVDVNKRGQFFFVIDVLIAVLILVTTIVVVANFFTPRSSIGGAQQYMDVVQEDFFGQRVRDTTGDIYGAIPEAYRRDELYLHQVIYWMIDQGDGTDAEDVFDAVVEYIPEQYGVRYYEPHNGDTAFVRESNRVTADNARVKLVRNRVTTLSPLFCDSVCLPSKTTIEVWS